MTSMIDDLTALACNSSTAVCRSSSPSTTSHARTSQRRRKAASASTLAAAACLRFVVRGTASVEVAVFFEKDEGIYSPILAPRLNHVDVGEQQDGLARACAPIADHDVRLRRDHAADKNIGGREPGRFPRARAEGGGDAPEDDGGRSKRTGPVRA